MVSMIKNRAFLWTAVLFFVNDEKSTSMGPAPLISLLMILFYNVQGVLI